MTRAGPALLLLALAFGCGKYGPPLRAEQAKAEEAAPKLEVPVPVPGTEPPAEAPAEAPAAPPEYPAEPEQEPPPEGAP